MAAGCEQGAKWLLLKQANRFVKWPDEHQTARRNRRTSQEVLQSDAPAACQHGRVYDWGRKKKSCKLLRVDEVGGYMLRVIGTHPSRHYKSYRNDPKKI